MRSAQAIPEEPKRQATSAQPDRKGSAHGPRYHVVIADADDATVRIALTAYGDDEAIALAFAAADGHRVEIWDGPRLVERFDTSKRSRRTGE